MVWVAHVIISALTVLKLFTQADVVCIYDASNHSNVELFNVDNHRLIKN